MAEILIKNFTQISKAYTEIAGGKGASLGEMTQAGIPVPEGFVILSNAFDRFIEETDLNVEIDAVLDSVDIKKIHTVENASEKIQAMVFSREMPEDIKTEILKFYNNLDFKFVAVRSSATSEDSASAAWAGQLDSFLNTTNETLLENVKKCWASLFTPRAIFYRFEKRLNKDKISVAVVVQKMIDSEESGIAFSVHPVTQDENQIIIEAGFGLGEAIVSGSITPDSYVVDKQGFSILDINANEQAKALYKKTKGGNEWKELGEKGKKQVLTEKEIVELSKLIVKIENHYGFPCDIEWAKEKINSIYITQSRPITTITSKIKQDIFELEFTRETDINSYYIWLNGYLEACKILKMSTRLPNKTFAIHHNGKIKAYTQKNNIDLMKKAILDTNQVKLKKIMSDFNSLFEVLKKDTTKSKDKDFLKGLIARFVINFTLGDIATHPLQKEALVNRKLTEELFYILSKGKAYKIKNENFEYSILTKTKIIPIKNKGDLYKFLDKNKVKIIEDQKYEKDFLKGQVAYKGFCIGKVKLILNKKDFNKFNEGDILVTEMTSPSYLPLIKNAKAIITDEGGITSHAAISSRELKKPCVIGTKIATKVLNDGDLIEVNANQGVIKILEKKKQ